MSLLRCDGSVLLFLEISIRPVLQSRNCLIGMGLRSV